VKAARASELQELSRYDFAREVQSASSRQALVPPPRVEASTRTRRTKPQLLLASAIGLMLIATLFGYLRWSGTRTQPHETGGRVMLAVLPFQNLTGDPGQEYFSDGLTVEMISQLGKLDPHHLGVIARTSVMHYKNSQTPLDQIGRELSVQYVIEGSVRRESNTVRVTAKLIQTTDQMHVWAREYDREPKGLLTLQNEIALEIADEIQRTFNGPNLVVTQLPHSPQQYEAYDLYLKGQYFLNKRPPLGLQEAAIYFQQATIKDPNYASAYAGLADSYALMGGYSERPQAEFISKARAAALKALEIDETLPEAHTGLALIVQNYDWDWKTAEKEFRRAIDLNPNYATAHHWYAEHLMWRGRFDEAFQESERARQLDPLSLIIAADNGAILYFSRQYDRAIEKFRSVLEMDPEFPRAHFIRGAYVEKGMFAEALSDLEVHGKMVKFPWYWAYLTRIYGRSGNTIQAHRALDQLLRLNQRRRIDPQVIADAYAGLGDENQALAWLEKAYAQHSTELVSIKVSPAYDFLRSNPRFQDLVRRVGLAN
jgi:TolB-like protein